MTEHKPFRPGQFGPGPLLHETRSPSGKPMTIDDLPPPGTKRWVARRKAEVVAGVHRGLITLDEACRRYHLSCNEFHSWQRLLETHGLQGLRTTRIKEYRPRLRKARAQFRMN